jgi:hypothetical protein
MADHAQAAAHWDAAYAQGDDTRSWFEKRPAMSLRMLDSAGGSPADALSTWVAALPLSAGQIRLNLECSPSPSSRPRHN